MWLRSIWLRCRIPREYFYLQSNSDLAIIRELPWNFSKFWWSLSELNPELRRSSPELQSSFYWASGNFSGFLERSPNSGAVSPKYRELFPTSGKISLEFSSDLRGIFCSFCNCTFCTFCKFPGTMGTLKNSYIFFATTQTCLSIFFSFFSWMQMIRTFSLKTAFLIFF